MTTGTIIRKLITGTVKSINRAKRQVLFVATRQEVDRDGEVVLVSGIQYNLTDPTKEKVKFKKDHGAEVLGTILEIQRATLQGVPVVLVLVQFLPENVSAVADQVYAEIQAGARDSYSIGFLVIEADSVPVLPNQTGRTYRRIELVEVSSVVNASNRGAVTLEKGASDGMVTLPAGVDVDDVRAMVRDVVRDVTPKIIGTMTAIAFRRALADDGPDHARRAHRGNASEVVLRIRD
jgi:hypothetical protein